jgi:hypothetical protein
LAGGAQFITIARRCESLVEQLFIARGDEKSALHSCVSRVERRYFRTSGALLERRIHYQATELEEEGR